MTENTPPRRLWRTLCNIMLNLLIILAAILALDWYRAPSRPGILRTSFNRSPSP